MANWSILKSAIASIIDTNGNQAITGLILQNALHNIISSVGENATFVGIATFTTNPGIPDGPVFYLATEAGIYYNFGGIEVLDGEAVILLWNSGAWTKKTSGFATQESIIRVEAELQNKINEINNKVSTDSELIEAISEGVAVNTEDLTNLYSMTGVTEYLPYSATKAYNSGEIVRYEGGLYRFTSNKPVGEWDYNKVEDWSEKKEREKDQQFIHDTIAEIQETIENISAGGGATNAASVTYNNAGGSLISTNVQNALTEVAGRLDDLDTANNEVVKDNEISEVRHIVNGVEYKTIVPSGETNNMDFVAPTEAGTSGYILQSSGDKSKPPTWADPNDFEVGYASNAGNAEKLGGEEAAKYVKKADLTEATTDKPGLMSAADKTKLDNLSEGGEGLEGYNLVSMTVNGDSFNVLSDSKEAPTIYTPTEKGQENAVLMADENGMPYWADQTDLHVGSADNASNATRATSATKATSDENGNNIVNTYATKNALNEVKELVGDREATSERMGYVILDPNKTFAEQVTEENTFYEIRDEFDLRRLKHTSTVSTSFTHTDAEEVTTEYFGTSNTFSVKKGDIIRVKYPFVLFDNSKSNNLGLSYTVTDDSGKSFYVAVPKDKGYVNGSSCEYTTETPVAIPKKCIFKFEGGSIRNGTIKMNDIASSNYDTLEISAPAYQIFKDIAIVGEFTSDRISIEWFGAVGDGKTDCTEAFRYAIKTLNATPYNGNYYGKNYAVHLNANRTYVVTGTLNHYDGEDHDVYSISFVGEKYAQVEDYQANATRGGGIQVNTSNVSLFANAKIQNVSFINFSMQGLWINWVADNVRFFDNCDIDGLLICNCYIQYIYTMFYNSGVHGVSRIHDNTFLGVYNFSYHENGIDWQKGQLVDSSIYGNYINGGAPNADKVPEIDNYFCTWRTINGSDIHHNFIDYYATVYGSSISYGNINSNHNHYQVLRYFHLTAKIHSINDYFNWNDPEASDIKDVFARFKVRTLNGNDGITYDIPPYIATDRYINNGDTVFKDMILEENIVNVVMRRGGISTKGSKFIVELHEHSYARNNAIVKTGGFTQVNGQASVSLQTSSSQEISIDKRLAHVVETLPTKTELVSGSFGVYGIGEYVKCGNQYYKMKCVWGGNGVVSYGLVKENPDFMSLGTEGLLTYVSSNKFTAYSKTCFISTKYAAGNEVKYKVESFTIPESLTSEIVTFYFDGLIVFNNLKNRYGGALALNVGDSLSVMRDINDKIIVIGYYCAAENNTTGLTTARPTSPSTGQCFFDTTLGKPIWWNGSAWVDATGVEI